MSDETSWIQELPKHWSAVPLRAAADFKVSNVDKIPAEDELPVRLCNYTDVYKNEFITADLNFMSGTATPEEIMKFGLQVGDVAITKDSESWDDIGVPALVTGTADDLVCGYHLAMLRRNAKKLDARFLFRCLQAKPIRVYLELAANGVTRFGIPKEEIGKLPLPLPPFTDQLIIADLLDRETVIIDKLVTEKERLRELLAEKRRVLITQAVTRGLDPRAPLSDSGVPWLGPIPKHWKIKRVKHITTKMEQGWSPQCDSFPATDNEWGVLKAGCVNGPVLDENENKRLPDSEEPIPALEIKPGALLMSRANTTDLLGSCLYVESVRPKLMLCDKLYRFHPMTDMVDGRYLAHFLRSNPGRYVMEREATGASNSMQNIGQETVMNLSVPLPPLPEQNKIVSYLAAETAKLDKLRAAAERTIALLKERRAALIAAAVTGKLEL